MSRLLDEYKTNIRQDLQSKLGLKNLFEVQNWRKLF